MDKGAWLAAVHRVARVRHDLTSKPCCALGQGLQLFVLSTAPVAPPELVPVKVKEPGESQ